MIGLAIGLATNPAAGVELSSAAAAPEMQGSWTDFLTGTIPTNVADAIVNVNMLQIVFVAIVVGAAAAKLGPKAEPFLRFNEAVRVRVAVVGGGAAAGAADRHGPARRRPRA